MISKIVFSLLFVLVRSSRFPPDEEIFLSPLLHPFGDEIFEVMTSRTQNDWNKTAPNNLNYHFFPIMLKMRDYCNMVKSFYVNHPNATGEIRNKYLEKPRVFAKILDEIVYEAVIFVYTTNIVLYDNKKNIPEAYLDDVEVYYHTNIMGIPFNPGNDIVILYEINRWLNFVSSGYHPRKTRLNIDGVGSHHVIELGLRGCWENLKYFNAPIKMDRRRRFVPVPNIPIIEPETFEMIGAREVETFSAWDRIPYYNNVDKKYEAIKIPFEHFHNIEAFAMIVMKPYRGHSLEIFRNFTGADFRKLFHEVNKEESLEDVHFIVPTIRNEIFYINPKGVAINTRNIGDCRTDPQFYNYNTSIRHKPFYVDRPFGIIIYHIPSQYVFLYALIRNATSKLSYQSLININGVEEAF